MVEKPAPAVAEGSASADGASLLAGVLARYSAVPLPSGDAAMLDAYLSRLIRCTASTVPILKLGWSMQVLEFFRAALRMLLVHLACCMHVICHSPFPDSKLVLSARSF